jgi:hypothetical protein
MARIVKEHYPWETTPPKGSFFVPSLKLGETREKGLKAAVYHHIRGIAEFAIVNGKLGVLFQRLG